MMNYIRDLRLIPIAVIACACLLALKAADLLLDGGSLIAGDNAPKTERTSVIRTTADVPQRIRAGVDLILDAGELPGVPSTVVSLVDHENHGGFEVLREGAVPAADVEARLR